MEWSRVLAVLTDPILPVFAIAAIGFAMGRGGLVSQADARSINRVAVLLFLPVMMFDIASSAPLSRFSPQAVAVYVGSEATIFALGYLLATRVFRRTRRESVLLAFSGIFANNAMYILPIGVLIYGQENVLPLTTVVATDATIAFGITTLVMQVLATGGARPSAILVSIARTPILIGIAAGLLVNLAGLPIPGPVQSFVGFNGSAAAPIALFALGVVLAETSLKPDALVGTFTTFKVLLFPAAVWAGFATFAPDAPQAAMYVLAASGPSGAMAVTLGLHYGVETRAILQVIVWTGLITLLSIAALA